MSSAAPAMRRWGDEYVVHHALSNDTYRLSASSGGILTALLAADGRQVDAVDSTSLTEGADTETALSALAELGFITQC